MCHFHIDIMKFLFYLFIFPNIINNIFLNELQSYLLKNIPYCFITLIVIFHPTQKKNKKINLKLIDVKIENIV